MENKEWNIESATGYKPMTSFYTDFCEAEKNGVDAVNETYKTMFSNWKSDFKHITELTLVLNWKIWEWIEVNRELCNVYECLWKELDEWCINNYDGEALDYYIKMTI